MALAAGPVRAARAAESGLTLEDLRAVSSVHGAGLSDERLRVLLPVLESRRAQLRALRSFDTDGIEPRHGRL
jgi:hypothetical protein